MIQSDPTFVETKLHIESPHVENSCCNRKKTRITSNVGLTICISYVNERKTQTRYMLTFAFIQMYIKQNLHVFET